MQMCRLQPAACCPGIAGGGSDGAALMCRALEPSVPHLDYPGWNNTVICTEISSKVSIHSHYAESRPLDGAEPKHD